MSRGPETLAAAAAVSRGPETLAAAAAKEEHEQPSFKRHNLQLYRLNNKTLVSCNKPICNYEIW